MLELRELDPGQRIVVTGMGTVSPLGNNVPESMDRLFAGESGIEAIADELIEEYPKLNVRVSARVHDFDTTQDPLIAGLSPAKLRFAHPAARYALVATSQALRQAGLATLPEDKEMKPLAAAGQIDPNRVAVSIGTGVGGADWVMYADRMARATAEYEGKSLSPQYLLNVLPERPATLVSIHFGAKGPLKNVNGACATGNMNIIDAAHLLKLGEADVVIAGGTEAQVTPLGVGLFDSTALDKNPDPAQASRPFHTAEAGFVMGEGSAVLVLETLEHALGRGAVVLAELAGYGEAGDAYHDTMLSGEGAVRAIQIATRDVAQASGIYVNAHATGTSGDKIELRSIGEALNRDDILAASSTKGATGHMLGAAGVFEAITTIEAVRRRQAPPTLKLDDRVAEAEGWELSPYTATSIPDVVAGVNDSFGFGGINAVTVWTKPEL